MPKAAGSKNPRKGKGKVAVKTSPEVQEPPAKKARKTASTSSSSKGKHGSKKGKAKEEEPGLLWNIFEKLSLDAIYTACEDQSVVEVPSYVQAPASPSDPEDSLTKSSTAVWKEARSRAERQVPECPPDQSEPQWAYLLFTRDCSFCDKTNIARIDWEHRRQNAAKRLPHVKDMDAVLDLLPYWKRYPNTLEMYYPIKAVEKLAARYAALKDQGNQEEFEEFREQMLARRKAIVDSVEGFKEWEEGLSSWSVAEANRKMVHEKFEALGYLPADFGHHSIMNGRYVQTRTPLTEAREFPFGIPNEAVVLAESFDHAIEALPALLKEDADRKKRFLVHRMGEGGAQSVSDPPAEEDLGNVFYATTVFFSKNSKLDIPICVDSAFESRAQHAKEAKHNTDSWQLLDDETASKVRVAESLNLADRRPRFNCNRCCRPPLDWLRPLSELVEHLKRSHWILDPLEKLDPSLLGWDRTIPSEPVML
ncbi:hypothetical protein FS837_001220 [Tulasnella sp. UAMH 9824]|nr:hypothetical protein FS837_001220 [Tulasnella sp. UAMH 9824]